MAAAENDALGQTSVEMLAVVVPPPPPDPLLESDLEQEQISSRNAINAVDVFVLRVVINYLFFI